MLRQLGIPNKDSKIRPLILHHPQKLVLHRLAFLKRKVSNCICDLWLERYFWRRNQKVQILRRWKKNLTLNKFLHLYCHLDTLFLACVTNKWLMYRTLMTIKAKIKRREICQQASHGGHRNDIKRRWFVSPSLSGDSGKPRCRQPWRTTWVLPLLVKKCISCG